MLGIFGRANKFQKLDGKARVFGVRKDNKQVAVSAELLRSHHFVVLSQFETPVVLTESEGGAVQAYTLDREVDIDSIGQKNGLIIDHTTGRKWRTASGKSVDGSPDLERVPVMTSFWFAWISFFPHTHLVK